MTDDRHLVIVETQKVKGFLFGSRFLRETRGASLLLDRLNRVETARLLQAHGGREVYLGGGNGRALFAGAAAAEAFAAEVRGLYRREAWEARVAVEVSAREGSESFAEWVGRAVGGSQAGKLAGGGGAPVLAGR